MSDLDEALHELKTAGKEVAALRAETKQRAEQLDRAMKEIQARGKRPFFGQDPYESEGRESKAIGEWMRGQLETKELSITGDGQGVTVREDWSDRIAKLIRESSPVRQVATVENTNSNEWEMLVDRGEPTSGWVGETAARNPTAASFMTRHKIAVHEHYAYPESTLALLEDSRFNVESWLASKLGTRFGRQEASAFMVGDGNGRPRGILDYDFVPDADFTWAADPDDYEIGTIYTGVPGDFPNVETDSIPPDDCLYDLVDSLKADYLPNASFLMTRAMRNKIRKLRDGDDRSLLQMSLADGVPDRLLGYPVRLAEDMAAPGEDEMGILFGDFRQAYTIVDRVGITIQRDTLTRPGFVRWYARKRVGGAVTNPEAIKALVLGVEPT